MALGVEEPEEPAAAAGSGEGPGGDGGDSDLDWFESCSAQVIPEARVSDADEMFAMLAPGVDRQELLDMLEDERAVSVSDSSEGEPEQVVGGGGPGPADPPVEEDAGGAGVVEQATDEMIKRCYHSFGDMTIEAVAELCGCEQKHSKVFRSADNKLIGDMRVSFEGQRYQGDCKLHPRCRAFLDTGADMQAVESALCMWIIAGTKSTADEHRSYIEEVKISLRERLRG